MGPSATPPKDQGRLTRLSPAPYAGRRRGRQRDRRDDIGGGHSMDLKKWIARVSVVVLALVLVAPTRTRARTTTLTRAIHFFRSMLWPPPMSSRRSRCRPRRRPAYGAGESRVNRPWSLGGVAEGPIRRR